MTFQEKIIQARKARALTQEDLAEAVGVSRQAVSKWETGEAKPDLEKLMALCKVLDLSMDYLCLDKKPEEAATETMEKQPPARRVALWSCLLCLILAMAGCVAFMLLHEENGDSETIPTGESQQSYYDMLKSMRVESVDIDVQYAGIDGDVLNVRFLPSIQVEPGMQVQIVVKDYITGEETYLETRKLETEYDCQIPLEGITHLDLLVVCSIDEVSVQLPLAKVQSKSSGYQITHLFQ